MAWVAVPDIVEDKITGAEQIKIPKVKVWEDLYLPSYQKLRQE